MASDPQPPEVGSPASTAAGPAAISGYPTGPADPTAALDKRKTIIGALVTLLVLVVIFVGIIPKFGSYAEAWESIKSMSPAWLVALGTSVLISILVYVWPYQAAIPGLAYRPGFVIRQTSFTISNAVPGGGAFGLAVQYAMLGNYGIPGQAATAGIAVTSVWSLFMTMGLPVLGVLAALTSGEVQQAWVVAAVVGMVAIIATVVVFWLILRSERSALAVGAFGQRISAPLTRRMKSAPDLTKVVMHFRGQIVGVVSDRWAWITGSNMIVVFSQFLVLFVAIRAVGGSRADGLTFLEAFAAFAISRMATMIPITPGGLGTMDAALIAMLAGFGLDESVAVAADLVWRAASFIPQVCLGVVTFIWWRIRATRMARGPAQAAPAG